MVSKTSSVVERKVKIKELVCEKRKNIKFLEIFIRPKIENWKLYKCFTFYINLLPVSSFIRLMDGFYFDINDNSYDEELLTSAG